MGYSVGFGEHRRRLRVCTPPCRGSSLSLFIGVGDGEPGLAVGWKEGKSGVFLGLYSGVVSGSRDMVLPYLDRDSGQNPAKGIMAVPIIRQPLVM